MTLAEQLERIDCNLSGETPPPVALQIRFAVRTVAKEVLDRCRHVMSLIAAAQRDGWRSDEEWRLLLPGWFLSSFDGHSLDELIANPMLWDFGSWLDAMKTPGWEWWSSCADDKIGMVRCVAYRMPFAIEPLLYLLRSAGASEVEFKEE